MDKFYYNEVLQDLMNDYPSIKREVENTILKLMDGKNKVEYERVIISINKEIKKIEGEYYYPKSLRIKYECLDKDNKVEYSYSQTLRLNYEFM